MIATADTIAEPTRSNEYREASQIFLRVLTNAMAHVVESGSPVVAGWAICYATGNPICEGVSVTDRAAQLGVSVGALSKQIRIAQRRCGIDESAYSYQKDHE